MHFLLRGLLFNHRKIFFSIICLNPYNWDVIPDYKLQQAANDLKEINILCKSTIFCEHCNRRKVIDKPLSEIVYCKCQGSFGYTDFNSQYQFWEPFLERQNILVWRRKHNKYSNLYSYKVHGTYSDMSLNAFMEVQLNSAFRLQWDSSVIDLNIVNSDPKTNSHLIHWIVKFPKFFSNRDYVFKRRFMVDKTKKVVVIISESETNDLVPISANLHRVKEYWSIMVLKSNDGFNTPGMEYTLTYFDNPGTSLPSYVTNFLVTTGFPNFLEKVHDAAINLQNRWENGEDVYVSLPNDLRFMKEIAKSENILDLENVLKSVPNITKDDIITTKNGIISGEIFLNNIKIPMKYKNVYIDLLEGIEVISPSFDDKMENLKHDGEIFSNKFLINRFKSNVILIKEKILRFITKINKQKEKNLKMMHEMEQKKMRYHNYDQQDDEDPTKRLIGLFRAVNHVLQKDKDMRTGRSLLKQKDGRR